jgi:hypothetical protein
VPGETQLAGDLLGLVSKKVNRPKQEIVGRVRQANQFLRLVDQWPLQVYELGEGSILYLEFVTDWERVQTAMANNNRRTQILLRNQEARKTLLESRIEEKDEDR